MKIAVAEAVRAVRKMTRSAGAATPRDVAVKAATTTGADPSVRPAAAAVLAVAAAVDTGVPGAAVSPRLHVQKRAS